MKGVYGMEYITFIRCLRARRDTLRASLKCREDRQNDFSSWRWDSDDELKGRLLEVENTLTILGEGVDGMSKKYELCHIDTGAICYDDVILSGGWREAKKHFKNKGYRGKYRLLELWNDEGNAIVHKITLKGD
jgi:hypothetical protein